MSNLPFLRSSDRKRARHGSSSVVNQDISSQLGKHVFSGNTLPQAIIEEDFTIAETNEEFRAHFHPDDMGVGENVLKLFYASSHPILEQ